MSEEIREPTPFERLMEAASAGDIGGVRAALADGAPLDQHDKWLRYPHDLAAGNGHLECLIYLGQAGASEFWNKGFMLRRAAESGQLPVVEYLVAQRTDIDSYNGLALRRAAENGHLDIVRYLVGQDISDNFNIERAWFAAAENGQREIVHYLSRLKEDPLVLPAWEGRLETIRRLVEQEGVNIHANNERLLRATSREGHLEIVRYLVEKGADIHAENEHAFRWAGCNGHLEVVRYLVEQGADLAGYGQYVYNLADRKDHFGVAEYLYRRMAPNIEIFVSRPWTSGGPEAEA